MTDELVRRALLCLLKINEWIQNPVTLTHWCHSCWNTHRKHKDTCELGNLIKELENAGKTDDRKLPEHNQGGD